MRVQIKLKADTSTLYLPRYRSKAEEEWSKVGPILLRDRFKKRVAVQYYEPITLHLCGEDYTPDFLDVLEDGAGWFIEIKGSKEQKNYRDARSKLRAAATLYPVFSFMEARRDEEKGWILEEITARAIKQE